MKNFQEFVNYVVSCKKQYDDIGFRALDVHVDESKKKSYYKKVGITNFDIIEQLEKRKTKEQFDRVDMAMELIDQYGSVYEISVKNVQVTFVR